MDSHKDTMLTPSTHFLISLFFFLAAWLTKVRKSLVDQMTHLTEDTVIPNQICVVERFPSRHSKSTEGRNQSPLKLTIHTVEKVSRGFQSGHREPCFSTLWRGYLEEDGNFSQSLHPTLFIRHVLVNFEYCLSSIVAVAEGRLGRGIPVPQGIGAPGHRWPSFCFPCPALPTPS